MYLHNKRYSQTVTHYEQNITFHGVLHTNQQKVLLFFGNFFKNGIFVGKLTPNLIILCSEEYATVLNDILNNMIIELNNMDYDL